MSEWYLNNPIDFKDFNKFEKIDKIKADSKKKQIKYLSLLLDGKKVK